MTGWDRRLLPFRFQLSDLTLFSLQVPLQVRVIRLTDDVPAVAEPAPPEEAPEPGSRGFLVRSLPLSAEQPAVRRLPGYLCYVPLQYQHCYIDLQGSFEDYRARFSARTRSTLTRKLRKFADHCGGAMRFKAYRSPGELAEFFTLARQVSRKTYQERLLDAGLPDTAAFRQGMMALAEANSVRAFILFDGDRPVSYLYCPVEDGVLIYAYLGYDPEYLKLSVGSVLQWLTVEELFRESGFRFFDFTEGQSEHKRLFSTHQVRRGNVFFMKRSLRNDCLVYSHLAMGRISAALGRAMERLGIKAAVIRLLRFGAQGA